jgi:hypothetical protein
MTDLIAYLAAKRVTSELRPHDTISETLYNCERRGQRYQSRSDEREDFSAWRDHGGEG